MEMRSLREELDIIPDQQLTALETERLYWIYTFYKKSMIIRLYLVGVIDLLRTAVLKNREDELVDDLASLMDKFN